MDWTAHLIYALAWSTFGFGHSLLADDRLKASLAPVLGNAYRLAYNVFAVAHLAVIVAIGWWLLEDAPAFDLGRGLSAALLLLNLAGWAGLLLALRRYDLGRFAGLKQLAEGDDAMDEEALKTDGVHAWVRHPLYAAGFVILWSAAVTPFALATAVWGSLYLWVGSRLEERRLEARFGESYRAYRRRVPAFVPWKGPAGRR